jgi:hypothetical protein
MVAKVFFHEVFNTFPQCHEGFQISNASCNWRSSIFIKLLTPFLLPCNQTTKAMLLYYSHDIVS